MIETKEMTERVFYRPYNVTRTQYETAIDKIKKLEALNPNLLPYNPFKPDGKMADLERVRVATLMNLETVVAVYVREQEDRQRPLLEMLEYEDQKLYENAVRFAIDGASDLLSEFRPTEEQTNENH